MKKFLALVVLSLAVVANASAAVTVTFQRVGHTNTAPSVVEIVNATSITGTYVTGGFTWTPGAIAGSPGSSPLTQRLVRGVEWLSPSGYIYVTTFVQATGIATTKIYSAPGTELTNGAAVPDATGTLIIYLGL